MAIALMPTLSHTAVAQVSVDEALTQADAAHSRLLPPRLSGEIGLGKIREDYYLSLALRLALEFEDWGMGLQLPVRLRILDESPEQRNPDYLGLFRREDWDEPSDFMRVVRYVYVGQRDRRGPYYIRLGELAGVSIGHGTIMHRYHNEVDADAWHTGLSAATSTGAFSAEGVLGDIVDPYIAGLRLAVRPMRLAMGKGDWDRFIVGTTLMTDSRAPYQLLRDTSGAIALDENQHLVVTRARALVAFGLDFAFEWVDTELLRITPYLDVNKMNVVGRGWGLHLGVLWGLSVPLLVESLIIDLRTEYRRVAGDYVSPYFNTSIEIERYQFLGPGFSSAPKLRALADSEIDARNGVFFDLLVGLPSFVLVGGEYIDYDGGIDDGSLRLLLEVPALEFFRFSAFYYRVGLSGVSDWFELDERSAIVAQATVPLTSIFFASAKWWRVWQATEPAGTFESVDDFSVGVGFSIPL